MPKPRRNPFEIESDKPLITAPVDRSGGGHESKRTLAVSLGQLARGFFDPDRFAVYGSDGDGTALEVVTDRANGVSGDGDCFDPAVRRQQPRDYRKPNESGDGAWSMPVFGPSKAKTNGKLTPQTKLQLVAEPKLTDAERLGQAVWRRRKSTSKMPAAAAV